MKRSLYLPSFAIALCLSILGCGKDKSQEDGASNESGLQKVTLMLNWFPEAEHGGFYAAKVHGIFEEYGLDVEIRPGGPNAPVAQELMTGRVEFAIANADDVLIFREQEAPIMALMAPIQDTPRCILVHKDSSVQTLSDLKGLTLQAGNGRPFLEFMKSKGLLEGVKVVPYTGVPNFVADKNSAMQGYNFSEPLLARQADSPARLLMVSEIGFNPYASCLVTTESYIDEHKELVGRMVQASRKGWQKYFENPEETNKVILDANQQGMTAEALVFGAEELKPLCVTEEVPIEKLGAMQQERWNTLVEQFSALGLLDSSKISADQVFNAEFLQEAELVN
ncbi:MAG: ABC transporter substrate-binding protein [Planctomycetota bacterium]